VVRNVRSVMCVPLVREERLIGLVYISSSTTNKTFTRHDLDLMAAIAAQVALALLNAEAFATIKELNAGLEAKVKARTLELERAYEELTQTQDQLVQTEKLATIGTLASGVAHEINNPLGAILSNAQLLQLDTDDPETLDSLSLIEAGARRCREIVEALLKYSHLAKNRHEAIDLRRLTQEALGVYERQLQLAEVSLTTEFAGVPAIQGDGKEIKQVVTNLLLNALDALREKHGLTGGRLSVRIVRELSGVRLIVSDDGAGMGPEVLKRIFDPFFTTKTVGSGTGLGLSVCQRIIERHGGTIQVTSAPGEGTTFTVELPVP
jgi:two-component system NtrC family sensor kinase